MIQLPIVTERLILRTWRPEDRAPFAVMNADPEVMRHFPELLSEEESNAAVDRFERYFAESGITFFAVEEKSSGRLVGTIGMRHVRDNIPIAPAVEIGWRLDKEVWNKGYATEGARAVLQAAFVDLAFPRVVAFTTPANTPSRRVMEKIGLVRAAELDFDHPDLPPDHSMRRHVVYAIDRDDWLASPAGTLAL
jgi:RimJ/RimL family protein N-acetyltransferase